MEAGPGRGSLMADALRAIAHAAPRFRAALSVHLIETSGRLRAIQRTAVPHATWHTSIGTLPEQPILLLANEFLDALPVRQFVRRGQGWAERHVQEGRWLELPSPCACFDEAGAQTEGDIIEVRESALTLAAALGDMMSSRPGVALFLDYGAVARTSGDSLQAIRNGRPTDPLFDPGTADLTAHVDFAALAAAARGAGAATHGPVPQGVFLTRLGLFQRTDRLARSQPPGRVLALIDAARRLAEPDRMGRLFKALALCHPGCPILPGFEFVTPIPLRSSILPVAHGFFTRQGGVSAGPYASLNCSLSSQDLPELVLRNRARAGRSVGADPANLVGLTQVHGATAVRVAEPWPPGAGPRADGMVTDRPGVALGIVTADCAPILLADPAAGVIGASHAGWRGAVDGIIEATVNSMISIGAHPERLTAAIGPCIRQPSYEVGQDLQQGVLAATPEAFGCFVAGRRHGHWQFDLAGYCAARLARDRGAQDRHAACRYRRR